MSQDIKTLELAKLYEAQKYFKDALDIYLFLDTRASSQEIRAGIKRMEQKLEDPMLKDSGKISSFPDINAGQNKPCKNESGQNSADKNIALLFEKWVKLMVLRQRLDNFKKIKARLV